MLTDLLNLLEPFSDQTNKLQSDAQSLSSIIPSLLDLECHMQEWKGAKELKKTLLADFRDRFGNILQPDSEAFNPVPAAACLLDPTLACIMFTPESATLLNAGKKYIASLDFEPEMQASENSEDDLDDRPALKKFKFLSSRFKSAGTSTPSSSDTVVGQLNRNLVDVANVKCENAFSFWDERKNSYNKLVTIAQDFISALASQAYVERIFSLCGILTNGRRNRMKKSLPMRVFLKLNKNILVD